MHESPTNGHEREGRFLKLVRPIALALAMASPPALEAREHPAHDIGYAARQAAEEDDQAFGQWIALGTLLPELRGSELQGARRTLRAIESKHAARLHSWRIRKAIAASQYAELVRVESAAIARFALTLRVFLSARDAVVAGDDGTENLQSTLRGLEAQASPEWQHRREENLGKYFKAYHLMAEVFGAKDEALAAIVGELQAVHYDLPAIVLKVSARLPDATAPSAVRRAMQELQVLLDELRALSGAELSALVIRGYLEGEREGAAKERQKDGPERESL